VRVKRAFIIAIAIAIALGTFYRFYRLDGKLYTNDEATTSVHVSGHTVAEYDAAAGAGKVTRIGDLASFQRVDPHTSMRDVVGGLAIEDPQHPPLFYVMERLWQSSFGDSIASRRALPAVFGTLAVAGAYFFGLTLTGSLTFAFVFATLVAVSPFHVLYAQQAREYSLWTCLIFASSTALLRAVAAPSPQRFAIYALALAAALYTDVLSVYTLVAHVIFTAVAYRAEVRRVLLPFALAVLAALAAFAPWIATLIRGRSAITNNVYLSGALPVKLFVLKWIFNLGAVFYDLDYERHATAILLVPIFATIIAGAVLLARHAGWRTAFFVAVLGATTALAFLIPDVVRHESRSTSSRYLIPAWLACECAVAFAIASWLQSPRIRLNRSGAFVFGSFILMGLVSVAVASQREFWWGDAGIAPIGPISRVLRAATPPVTVVFVRKRTYDFGPMLLADAVDPAVRLVYLNPSQALARSKTSGSAFLLDPDQRALSDFQRRGYNTEAAYRQGTADATVAAMRREAASSRKMDGPDASLWRLR